MIFLNFFRQGIQSCDVSLVWFEKLSRQNRFEILEKNWKSMSNQSESDVPGIQTILPSKLHYFG